MRIRGLGSGMEKFRSGIRDGKNSDPGSGINIPYPQHWGVLIGNLSGVEYFLFKICGRRDLDTFGENHLTGCNLVDPDMNGGELNIKIPPEAFAQNMVADGKPLR